MNYFVLDNYSCIYNEGNLNQNDGIVIYVKSAHSYQYYVTHIANTKVVELSVSLDGKKITLTAICRSPTISPYEFNSDLAKHLSNKEIGDYNFLIGDTNIDIK